MSTPAATGVWVRETLPAEDRARFPDALPMDRAIGKLRDEITGVAMDRHKGHNRELALVMTKLDEALHWALAYGQSQGTHVLMPKAEILQYATAEETEETGSHA